MAALNQTETERLRDVKSVLEYVLRHGYDPKLIDKDPILPNVPQAIHTEKLIKAAISSVHTVTAMKGYYPK